MKKPRKPTWADVIEKAKSTLDLVKKRQIDCFDPLLDEAVDELEKTVAMAERLQRGEA